MKKQSRIPTKKRRVTFKLIDSWAREISLVGDFNQWDPERHPMKKGKQGRWTKTVCLTPGIYQYKFLVDGKWITDKRNPVSCTNSFGGRNSLISIDSK